MTEFEQRLHDILLTYLGSQEAVLDWWANPSKDFEGAIPDDIYHSNNRALVVNWILSKE